MNLSRINIFDKTTPRWIVFVIDLAISLVSISAAYILRFNFNLEAVNLNSAKVIIPLIVMLRALTFLLGGTYTGIIRYTSSKDAERIFVVVSAGSLVFAVLNVLSYFAREGAYIIPFSILIIEYIAVVFLMTSSRIIYKAIYYRYLTRSKVRENILIYGSDEFGIMAKHALDSGSEVNSTIVAFIDHNNKKVGSKLENVKIYSTNDLECLIEKECVDKVIIAKKDLNNAQKQAIVEKCLDFHVKVWEVPKFESWVNGELSVKQIRAIKIEDLLERDPIQLDLEQINEQVNNKTVLVTGAAGSIGSEMVRQIARFNPKSIVLFDQAESPLYDVELSLKEELGFYNAEIVIGDVRDLERTRRMFDEFKPDLVYHAAAYKHVPMMENNPSEAIKTNVLGTKNVADLSLEFGVERFVMVSTDKAVNPTNVMGASKRIAEIYTQSLNHPGCPTHFITTRFGNVLGSNGSVIPRFKAQIDKGGPVTVTHPEITRYFMTIPEACQLVMQAGAIGKGGKIFIFDMGKSVKIVDLAYKMIKLSGLKLGTDIQVQFTGLRPGEKLYEELLNVKENTVPTKHPRIMIAKVREYQLEEVQYMINQFDELLPMNDNYKIVAQMKAIVPEFKSMNSIYEQLDKVIVNKENEFKNIDIAELKEMIK
ncbi:NAD-dependent epimerase/dehydratase family protein [Marinifilum sp. N1E240]|uniref:polysaccharide biosynthesis protein n=1 Tax=Marinifilum sp. N1E240 TaxID=2608082 RepID=UPI00128CC001|nr:nucleoside-diphosphate sugar epimerase/dehydratase [Marinifilum sp. N1E240]MPQ46442.1 NAD-dependent epimerase/dehydratase family protein [Marinifilum sp. N1E240]